MAPSFAMMYLAAELVIKKVTGLIAERGLRREERKVIFPILGPLKVQGTG